jgi:small GTP-binding protein
MSDNHNIEIMKVVIIGQSSVGKTSIISQFVEKAFQTGLQSTVGGSFNSKSIKCEDLNKTLKLEIWDTAGQERYRSVTKMFYKDSDVALLVYDITSFSSFEDLQNYWVQQVLECSLKKTMLIIVANKSDLIEKEQVDEEEARNYAKSINAHFFIISATNNDSVNEMFKEIAKIYSGAKIVNIIEGEEDTLYQFKKIRKDSVRVKKIKDKDKKKKFC